ncbi:MAG: dynamin family protein [Betaproteobacteria bacterium]|nr:dynamin family protein [Betaproteobacteria bacterium]
MPHKLGQGVALYQQRRDQILLALEAYRLWLERNGDVDSERNLRLYDMAESLRRDKLMLAFVAEYSRGKSELINALFFSDYKRRLMPSDIGRTTMCPTELFYDAGSEPYLRLLPIESRLRDDSISALKRMPVEWSSVRLDPEDVEQMARALRALADVKTVSVTEAQAMGLCSAEEALRAGGAGIEIPAWRYAMINFPHSLLKSGLAILDTPGLNALGVEPELTLNIIPSAHGVLFLLATDTGVTRSDLEIWERSVRRHANHYVAILNKIDMLWDDIKTDEEIEVSIRRQKEQTAQQLHLMPSQVIALSAQKALLGKIRGDQALIERSGIGELENLLVEKILPSRQEILYRSVCDEVMSMVEISRQGIADQLMHAQRDLEQLETFSGKNREIVTELRDKLIQEKKAYDLTATNFRVTRNVIQEQGQMLLDALAEEVLDAMLVKGRATLDECWTTPGLVRGMRGLFGQITDQFHEVESRAENITRLLKAAYLRFHQEHSFPLLEPPVLSLEIGRQKLAMLAQQVDQFARDPMNLMMEKRFMVKKFYLSLVSEARGLFVLAKEEVKGWLRRSMDPVVMRIQDHKRQLEVRVENIRQVHDNLDNLQVRAAALQSQRASLETRLREINAIISGMGCSEPEGFSRS